MDLASADDVRSLLQDAMASHPSAPVVQVPPVILQQNETVVMPSGASVSLPIPSFRGDGCSAPACNSENVPQNSPNTATIPAFLNRLAYRSNIGVLKVLRGVDLCVFSLQPRIRSFNGLIRKGTNHIRYIGRNGSRRFETSWRQRVRIQAQADQRHREINFSNR